MTSVARFDLAAELDTLRAAVPGGGHVAKTLLRSPTLRIVLIALDAGARIPEHRAEGAIALHVLDGRVRLRHGERAVELARGEMCAVERDVVHSIDALERSGVLLAIAWTGHRG